MLEKERLYKGEGVGGREGRIGGRKERLFTEFHFYYSVNKKKRIKAIFRCWFNFEQNSAEHVCGRVALCAAHVYTDGVHANKNKILFHWQER